MECAGRKKPLPGTGERHSARAIDQRRMSGKRNGRSSRICGRDFSGADGSCLCRYDPVSDISRERIAVVDVAAVKAAPEPFHALGRGPMVEAFRNDVTLAALLQRVVADLLRRIESPFPVALRSEERRVG